MAIVYSNAEKHFKIIFSRCKRFIDESFTIIGDVISVEHPIDVWHQFLKSDGIVCGLDFDFKDLHTFALHNEHSLRRYYRHYCLGDNPVWFLGKIDVLYAMLFHYANFENEEDCVKQAYITNIFQVYAALRKFVDQLPSTYEVAAGINEFKVTEV